MVSLKSAPEVLDELARMVRMQRLNRGWTQAEMARRAGLKLPTYIVFERWGRISLLRFLSRFSIPSTTTHLGELGKIKDLQAFTLTDLKRQAPTRVPDIKMNTLNVKYLDAPVGILAETRQGASSGVNVTVTHRFENHGRSGGGTK